MNRRTSLSLRHVFLASLAALASAAFAADVPDGTPTPPDARRCVVVAGTSTRFPDAEAQRFWANLNRGIVGRATLDLGARHYEADPLFREPDVPRSDPPAPLVRLMQDRCAKVLQFRFEAKEDAQGSYVGWEVAVMRYVEKDRQGDEATISSVVDWSHFYRFPRTAAWIQSFVPSEFAHQVLDDVMASGTLPGLHERGKVTEEDLRARFDAVMRRKEPLEVHVRLVLVESREQAQAALDRIRKGDRFEQVARDLSKDAGSASRGGDLGWVNSGDYVPDMPEFARAVRALEPQGLVPEPVKTSSGWVVIEVLGVRPFVKPAFEAARATITADLADEDRQRARLEAQARSR